jgi:16S rRNA (guanine966-N2)-methyltransferase
LRPSGDRCRETLFNWLQPFLHRARCADLFAGTGVLGLEAVSRGAAAVVLVERSRQAAAAILDSIAVLSATGRVSVVEADALSWLANQPAASIDIVFVDPPFASALAEPAMQALAQGPCLRRGGLAYLESAEADAGPLAGPGWEILKERRLGEVRMQLCRKV